MADDVAAPLPDLDWRDQSVISVDTGNAGAVITTMTIHLSQDVPGIPDTVPQFTPLFVYGSAQ